jgi:hypothetical protein
MKRLSAKAELAAGACLVAAFGAAMSFTVIRPPGRPGAAGPSHAAATGTARLMATGTRPAAPATAGRGTLSGVSARTATDAWAVGTRSRGTCAGEDCTLTEHWNGHTWSAVRSPNPGRRYDELSGVSALSGQDAWAVGAQGRGPGAQVGGFAPLILHWDGRAWSAVPAPRGNGGSR